MAARLRDQRQALEDRLARFQKIINRLNAERVTAPWLRHLYFTYEFANHCRKLYDGSSPGLCIAHDTYALAAADALRRGKDVKVLYDAVEVPSYRDRSIAAVRALAANPVAAEFLERGELDRIRRADAIVAISPGLAEVVANAAGVPAPSVVRNCRNWQAAPDDKRLREDCGCRPQDKVILILNSVNFGDGLEDVLEAIKRLPPAIKIATLGDIYRLDDGGSVVRRIRRMRLHSRICRLEPQAPGDLVAYVSGADAVMIVRRATNLNNVISLPNRVFEAVMARTPLLVPDLQDLRRIAEEHGLGLVYRPDDVDDMEQKMHRILEPAVAGEIRNSLERASHELCWEREQRVFQEAVDRARGDRSIGGRTVILANKSLQKNNRIHRMAATLVACGHQVEVVCRELPLAELRVPGVVYHEVNVVETGTTAESAPDSV